MAGGLQALPKATETLSSTAGTAPIRLHAGVKLRDYLPL